MKDARPGRAAPGRTAATTRGPLAGLIGFLALLVVLLAASYAVGTLAGPVAPGLHPGDGAPAGTAGDGTDMGGMDMGGMGMEGAGR
ncbi:hypothetical protein LUW75_14570 [Streptomyces sp. MRC013]|uniref:hypothetical protein n=1 Tax=Streptomyces sp. MRC013 TaxID=2898276 RepID=UPI0020273E90|nr:hypothetical protein [Streptomyces sp. MRC013]URM91008.1 hypothetical protein LUW75_14570 [Streptomyces sp. MRC013]